MNFGNEQITANSSPLVGEGRAGGLIASSLKIRDTNTHHLRNGILSPSPCPRPRGAGKTLLLRLSLLCLSLFLLPACRPTYKKEAIEKSIKELAQKEYGLEVEVKEAGRTLGVRFEVKNLLGEMVSEDQQVWKQMDHLMLLLSRVTLSMDIPPDFFVLEIADRENPRMKLVFTRFIQDIKKMWAEALSRNQYMDRLLIEFIIGGQTISFDPAELDLVRLMMMAMDVEENITPADRVFKLEEVRLPDFLAKVVANYARRLLREKKDMSAQYLVRQISGSYNESPMDQGQFKILLDLVTNPGSAFSPRFLEVKLLPLVAKEAVSIFKSYRFDRFSTITVVEKNTGKGVTVPRS